MDMQLNVLNSESLSIFAILNKDFLKIDQLKIDNQGVITIPMNLLAVSKILSYCVDKCYVQYDTMINTCLIQIEAFAVVHTYDLEFILSVMNLYEQTDYAKFNDVYNRFRKFIVNSVKQKIRTKINIKKGKFVSDKIESDTYFQLRFDNKNIYFVINQWWNKINKRCKFIDIGDDSTVYVASE